MKKVLLFIFSICLLSLQSKGQEQFIPFLKSSYLPNCFAGLNHDQIDRLMTEFEIQADWTTFRVEYDRGLDVLYLYSSNPCDDIHKVHLKHLFFEGDEFIMMYKERIPNSNTYGRLKAFKLQDEEYVRGRKIDVTWSSLFGFNERQIRRLEQIEQYPKYLLRFEHENIVFEVPWNIYSFEEGRDNDGFSMSGAKAPVRMPYSFFLR